MKKVVLFLLIILNLNIYAQHKTDVLVLGGTESGASAALQAARSGVKSILIEQNSFLIGNKAPDMSVPAFSFGIWKEWKDSCKKDIDSLQLDPRVTLEKILVKETKLKYFKETKVVKIKKNKNNWEVSINRNGKVEKIKAKVLVDAVFESQDSDVLKSGIVSLKDGYLEAITPYSPEYREKPYSLASRLYRTSGAAAFGKDSSLHFFPMGAFIAKGYDNLLFANPQAALKGFDSSALNNIALWVNVGQMVGALAAYGPFFNTTAAKATVRIIQGEIFNFKGLLYPVMDVDTSDKAWRSVQRIIATELLKFDFVKGEFKPNDNVYLEDLRTLLSQVHPRARIWFIENKAEKFTIKQTISLISFIGGKEVFDLERELSVAWKDKYAFDSDFKEDNLISRKEFAVLFDNYLALFNVRVNMAGYIVK